MYMRNQINYEEKKGELNVKPKLYRFLHCIIELNIFFQTTAPFSTFRLERGSARVCFLFFYISPELLHRS